MTYWNNPVRRVRILPSRGTVGVRFGRPWIGCLFPLALIPASAWALQIDVTKTIPTTGIAALPYQVTVIDRKEIEESPAKTLPDLLEQDAGIHVRSFYSNDGAGSSLDLRGFGATATQNTLVLVNGQRINGPTLAGLNLAAIPLSEIARIEIIRGGGAVRYGAGAVGGVINIITKSARPQGTQGNARVGYGSFNAWRASADISSGVGATGVYLNADHFSSDGYRTNNQIQEDVLNGTLSWDGKDRRAWLNFGADRQLLGLPGTRTVNPLAGINQLATDPRGTSTPDDYANQKGFYFQPGIDLPVGGSAKWVLDGELRYRNQQAGYYSYDTSYGSNLLSLAFTPHYVLSHALFSRSGQAAIGIDGRYYAYHTDSFPIAPNPYAFPYSWRAYQERLAFFGEDRERLGNSNTLLTLGVRLDWLGQEVRQGNGTGAPDFSQNHTEPSAEIGLRHWFGPDWSVYGSLVHSVRYAMLDESFNVFSGQYTALKPQTGNTANVGLDYARGPVKLAFNGYYSRFHNEIALVPVTFAPFPILANTNLPPTERAGFGLDGSYALSRSLEIKGHYQWTLAQFLSGPFAGNTIPLVPRQQAGAMVLWRIIRPLSASVALNYVGSQFFDNDQSNTFQKMPAYATTDVKLAGDWGPWRLTAEVYNIFDRQYFSYGVRSLYTPGAYAVYPMPGRNFWVSLSRSF